jgi:hypothetical protein
MRKSNKRSDISFSQFIEYLLDTNNDDVNPHWRRQTFIMANVNIDKFVNLDNVKNGLAEVSQLLRVKNIIKKGAPKQSQKYGVVGANSKLTFAGGLSNVELIREKEKVGFFPSKSQFYNTELKDKVSQIYKEDFIRFQI